MPPINLLLSANDRVIFCNVDITTNHLVKRLLEDYGRVFEQQVNTNKKTMVFNKNTLTNIREEIRAFWMNEIVQNYEKYLGLPPMVGRSKVRAFSNKSKGFGRNFKFEKKNFSPKGVRKHF